MTDIVERLRTHGRFMAVHDEVVCIEAADEIERLRAELQTFKDEELAQRAARDLQRYEDSRQ
jgi:hypothetical protein